MKYSSNTKLTALLAMEDSPEKLRLLRLKVDRLYEGHNMFTCLAEINRLASIYEKEDTHENH